MTQGTVVFALSSLIRLIPITPLGTPSVFISEETDTERVTNFPEVMQPGPSQDVHPDTDFELSQNRCALLPLK